MKKKEMFKNLPRKRSARLLEKEMSLPEGLRSKRSKYLEDDLLDDFLEEY